MMEENILINGIEFKLIAKDGWISKDDNPWILTMKTPQFNWKSCTIQSTEEENLNVIKSMLEIALDEIDLELKKIKGVQIKPDPGKQPFYKGKSKKMGVH